jgi:hypothetical protein
MKNLFLLFFIFISLISFSQEGNISTFYQFFSPSYSFSYAKVKTNNLPEYTSFSNGLSISLFRYGFRYKKVECTGGFSFHYISGKINNELNDLNLAYTGFTPELRAKFFPLNLDKGFYVGAGAQFFVFPYLSDEIKLTTFRPMFLTGVSKEYGFTVFLVPPILSGKRDNINLNKDWYLGMEVDIPWSKIF